VVDGGPLFCIILSMLPLLSPSLSPTAKQIFGESVMQNADRMKNEDDVEVWIRYVYVSCIQHVEVAPQRGAIKVESFVHQCVACTKEIKDLLVTRSTFWINLTVPQPCSNVTVSLT
jgi:hypothetical protein